MQTLAGSRTPAVAANGTATRAQLSSTFVGLPFTTQQLQRSQRRSSRAAPVTAMFDFMKKKPAAAKAAPVRSTIVPKPSYNIPAVLLGISGLGALTGSQATAWLSGTLGAFLAFQASRVKFVFGPDALEVVIGEEQKESENAFVGGENKWAYDTFTNWEFWWPGFPVLVYFKETQTKPEGQIHFFPVIFDGKQVYDAMVERCGPSETSGPKDA